MIKAVLFDIDGTLVDSNELHVMAWEEAFRASGYSLSGAAIRKQIGKGGDMLIPALLPDSSPRDRTMISERHDEIFKAQYLPRVVPFQHAADLIARLHDNGLQVLLASSAKQTEVEHYIKLLAIQEFLTAATSADDVKRSKPAGDIFASALEKAAPTRANEAVAVGDTPYDVIAAGKCSVKTIALRSGGFSENDLKDAGAFAIYASVGELFATLDTSPLASSGV